MTSIHLVPHVIPFSNVTVLSSWVVSQGTIQNCQWLSSSGKVLPVLFFPISACKLLYLLYKPWILTCCVAARMGTHDVVWPETCPSPVVQFIKDSKYFGLFIYYDTSQHIVSVYLFRWQDMHNNLLFCFLSAPTVICIFSKSSGIFETRLIVLRIFWSGK